MKIPDTTECMMSLYSILSVQKRLKLAFHVKRSYTLAEIIDEIMSEKCFIFLTAKYFVISFFDFFFYFLYTMDIMPIMMKISVNDVSNDNY